MNDLPTIQGLNFTHIEKLLYPEDHISKADVITYYNELSKHILPHLKERPLILQRYPNGLNKDGFFQQNPKNHFPQWIDTLPVKGKERQSNQAMECHTRSDLLFLINQDALALHTWASQKKTLNYPDFVVFDLDPPSKEFHSAIEAAFAIRKQASKLEMQSFVMTTGSKGLHVLLPIKPELSFDDVRSFAKNFAKRVCEDSPHTFTVEQRKEKREGRLFIDYLRNSFGQATICPYSLRAIQGAPVATPLDWRELMDKSLTSQTYHLHNIRRRLVQREDPWQGIGRHRCSLKKRMHEL